MYFSTVWCFKRRTRGVTQRCTFSTGWCFKLRMRGTTIYSTSCAPPLMNLSTPNLNWVSGVSLVCPFFATCMPVCLICDWYSCIHKQQYSSVNACIHKQQNSSVNACILNTAELRCNRYAYIPLTAVQQVCLYTFKWQCDRYACNVPLNGSVTGMPVCL